jgi:peptidoglycan/LPS O-acetylase OafA/YrhL
VPAIDGLRAVAVLAVVAYHAFPRLLPGGFAGVDVFFVISGFVVTSATAPRRFDRTRDLFAGFYARRIVRIVPALLFLLLGAWFLAMLFIPPKNFAWAAAGTGLAAFFGASNIALALAPADYFTAESAMNPFLHTWTLGVEEQFYLLFPLILWLGRRDEGADGVPRRALAAVALASLASLLLYIALSAGAPKLAFYLMPARFWELGAGVLLCLARPLWIERLRRIHRAPAALAWGVSFLALGWFLVRLPGPHLHLPPLVLPVAGAAGLLALACARPAAPPARALATRPAVLIGLASYSIYLWHWPVLALMRWTCGLDTPAKLGGGLLAIAAASALSYRFVERPVRAAFRDGAVRQRTVLIAGPAALAAGAAAAWLLLKAEPLLALGVDFDRPPALDGCAHSESGRPIEGGEASGWRPCRDGRSTLFVIGDSHAAAYDPMFALYAARTGRRVVIYMARGCELPALVLAADRLRACARFHEAAVGAVARSARGGDTIFLSSLHMRRPADPPLTLEERLANRREAALRLRPLAATGARLVLEAPKPVFPSPPFRCVDWFRRSNPVCRGGFAVPRQALLDLRAPALQDLRTLASSLPRATLWDPFPFLCPGDPCTAYRNGQWLFRDQDHLTPYANRLLLPSFTAAADALRPTAAPADDGR